MYLQKLQGIFGSSNVALEILMYPQKFQHMYIFRSLSSEDTFQCIFRRSNVFKKFQCIFRNSNVSSEVSLYLRKFQFSTESSDPITLHSMSSEH